MKIIDSIIIGGGPAGLCSAIYLARSGREVLLVEAGVYGGQVFLSHLIENYPGFVDPIKGSELSANMKAQADRMGVNFKTGQIKKISKIDNYFSLLIGKDELFAKTVIIATGSKSNKLGIPGENELYGSGVSYCSTCDGMFYKNKNVFVLGGGSSAVNAAEYLSRICNHVSIVHRRNEFRAEKIVVDRIKKLNNVSLYLSSNAVSINGKFKVESISISDLEGKEKNIDCDGIFIYVGYTPQNELVRDILELDKQGYIIVDKSYETSLKAMYAAGDIISKDFRQIATAIGDGCSAALNIDKYLSNY